MATRDPKTDLKAFLGERLARGRVAAGFSSQEALAARLGFDRAHSTPDTLRMEGIEDQTTQKRSLGRKAAVTFNRVRATRYLAMRPLTSS